MKKLVIMGMLATAMMFNAGCTDGEVAAGAIGVIVGIGLGSGPDHHDHHRPPPYHRGRHWDAQANVTLPTTGAAPVAVQVEDTQADSQVADFAFKYNISLDAANKVNDAFQGVQKNGVSSFATIGLNKSDIQAIMKHQLPETSSIKSMASKLDMSEAQARDFLVAMNREFQAQASDVSSPYWQACMAKGSWKTAENMYCKSTSWNGCAPETGATLCY